MLSLTKNIVLVHGIFSTGKMFLKMKRTFEENGFRCFSPTLKPIDGRFGLDDLAIKLQEIIDENLGENSEFILVGFSMGGIICRYYLQELGGIKRVTKFISISVPHHGSYLAYLYPGKGSRQLKPKSDFLFNLQSKEDMLEQLDLYSFRTPFDLSIIPSKSSNWEIAQNKKHNVLVHRFMTSNNEVIKDSLKSLTNK